MIKQWSVSNFKSCQEKVKLEFAPLTLFVGQNSAGKSTIIQSILLTAQTLQSNVISRSVVLNGRIIRLGGFSDIRSNNSESENITFEFEIERSKLESDAIGKKARTITFSTYEFQSKFSSVKTSFSFSAGKASENLPALDLQPRLEGGGVSYRSHDIDANSDFEFKRTNEATDILLGRLGVTPENVRIPDLTSLDFKSVGGRSSNINYRRAYRLPTQTQDAGVMMRHFLPIGVCAAFDAVEVEVDSFFEMLVDQNARYNVRTRPQRDLLTSQNEKALIDILIEAFDASTELSSTFSKDRIAPHLESLRESFNFEAIAKIHSILQQAGRKKLSLQLFEKELEIKSLIRGDRKARREISAFPVSNPILYASDYLTNFFTENLKYLGPLRDEPKAIYPLAGYNDPNDVGFRGEFTAAVLDNNKTSKVTYIPSSQFPFSNKNELIPIRVTLVEAVQDWLEYLGIASGIATEDKGKFGHELTISTSNSKNFHDLTHVGVGVSQTLPIVVLALLAESGSTLIFEQPELHLNPKVQTRLADFFMSLTFVDKQCLVETHSEYLVSRLRYLAAVAKDVAISEQVKIYFVEKPSHQSIYSEVQINDAGVIKNWPDGFFDETERNSAAIIQAQIERSRSKKNRNEKSDGK